MCFWLCWVFTVAQATLAVVRGLLRLQSRLLGAQASVALPIGLSSCDSWALEHRLNSGSAWASLLHNTWDLPGSGIKPMSPALAWGFFTRAAPHSCFTYFSGDQIYVFNPSFLIVVLISNL